MVVITLENCPIALRGDLTKWLQEISLGVYVGQVSARVRDELWKRICDESKNGRATMVFSARNEQRYDFRVHNTSWEPIDFDGIKLMMRPSPARTKQLSGKRTGFSNTSKRRKARKAQRTARLREPSEYVVVDLETTGTDSNVDEIIEIAAVKYMNGKERGRMGVCVRPSRELPKAITQLTGLRPEDFDAAVSIESAMQSFIDFVGDLPLVAHNAEFDMAFLRCVCERHGFDELDDNLRKILN